MTVVDTLKNQEWYGEPEGVWEEDLSVEKAQELEAEGSELVVGAVRLSVADNNWNHLWPRFREHQRQLFSEMESRGVRMVMFEGFRSDQRQLWLYGQGRPSSKPYGRRGQIVTGLRIPKRHGGGTASDNYPSDSRGRPIFRFTPGQLSLWKQMQKKHGVEPTAFAGDYGHIQLICSYNEQTKARSWARAGFPEFEAPRTSIKVHVNDKLVWGANAYVQEGVSWGTFRPIAQAMNLGFHFPKGGKIEVWYKKGLASQQKTYVLNCEVRHGATGMTTWIPLAEFRKTGAQVFPDIDDKIVRITT